MIYFLFDEKEREELVSIVDKEVKLIKKAIGQSEHSIMVRALIERENLLVGLKSKISIRKHSW